MKVIPLTRNKSDELSRTESHTHVPTYVCVMGDGGLSIGKELLVMVWSWSITFVLIKLAAVGRSRNI